MDSDNLTVATNNRAPHLGDYIIDTQELDDGIYNSDNDTCPASDLKRLPKNRSHFFAFAI
jgi:hypothetical protein